MTTLYNIEKLKWKRVRVFSRCFQSIEKQISRYADNTRKLWKTTVCCRKARECIKESLITYSDSWEYWCIAWRGLEYGKLDEWMSANIGKNYGTYISQKIWRGKVSEELVLLQLRS